MNRLTLLECDKIYKKAESAMKTSIFSLKFSPDYLSASSYYQEAGKGYLELKLFDKSIDAFMNAVETSKKLNDSWSEGQNYEEIAKIYLLEKDDLSNGLKALKQSSYSYQIAGKSLSGPRLYLELSSKLKERQKIKNAILLLQEGFTESYDCAHDELARVMIEDIFVKLLDIYCLNDQFVPACDITEKMIKMQIEFKEKKNKITKNYSRVVLLRLIMKEEYLCQGIIDKMYSSYDSSCGDDIEDIKNLLQYFTTCNKQKFNSTITYSFELYENNLIKKLKAAFDNRSLTLCQNSTKTENIEVEDINNEPNKQVDKGDFSDNWK